MDLIGSVHMTICLSMVLRLVYLPYDGFFSFFVEIRLKVCLKLIIDDCLFSDQKMAYRKGTYHP